MSLPIVLLYSSDLFFSVRIQDVIAKLGGRVRVAENVAELAAGLAEVPVLAIIELGSSAERDWVAAVAYARQWTRGIPLLAFGSHVDAAALALAREAGCNQVWTKGKFMQELPILLAPYLNPNADAAGCVQLPNALVREGIKLFNAGAFYECHNALEAAWMAEQRPCRDLYQGILQLAIALYHLEEGRYLGADKMFRRAINKLQRLPPVCQGIDAAGLLQTTRRLAAVLHDLGPDRLAEFPRSLYPILTLDAVEP